MTVLDLEKLEQTPLTRDPFDYVIVRDFIRGEQLTGLMNDYPAITRPGSFPVENLEFGARFAALVSELEGESFRKAVECKFGISLDGRPTMMTVRGACRKKDGKIHTDTESKLITVLLYMNPPWLAEGGRLRLLRSRNLDDVAAEVPPDAGTLLMFRRANNSYHGHHSFSGQRRAIQLNWITEQKMVDRQRARHSLSSVVKRLNPFVSVNDSTHQTRLSDGAEH